MSVAYFVVPMRSPPDALWPRNAQNAAIVRSRGGSALPSPVYRLRPYLAQFGGSDV